MNCTARVTERGHLTGVMVACNNVELAAAGSNDRGDPDCSQSFVAWLAIGVSYRYGLGVAGGIPAPDGASSAPRRISAN